MQINIFSDPVYDETSGVKTDDMYWYPAIWLKTGKKGVPPVTVWIGQERLNDRDEAEREGNRQLTGKLRWLLK